MDTGPGSDAPGLGYQLPAAGVSGRPSRSGPRDRGHSVRMWLEGLAHPRLDKTLPGTGPGDGRRPRTGWSTLGTRPRVAIHHTSLPARSWASAHLVTSSATVPGTTLRPSTIWPLTSSQTRATMSRAQKRTPALPEAVTGRRTR